MGGRAISDLVDLPVTELKKFFDTLTLTAHEAEVGKRLLTEINNRIRFLLDVGLGYLTLNRLSNTLSGGESQRINLATSLGSSLVGSLYILDEPSIGLHLSLIHIYSNPRRGERFRKIYSRANPFDPISGQGFHSYLQWGQLQRYSGHCGNR